MWIKTATGNLFNADQHSSIKHEGTHVVANYGDGTNAAKCNFLAHGTSDEMTAVLDCIGRAVAAGLPFLDLGQQAELKPDSSKITAIMDHSGGGVFYVAKLLQEGHWVARVFRPWSMLAILSGEGPTPDAAIANLKETP